MKQVPILAAALLAATAGVARADELEGDLVYLPVPVGESLTVENRLGTVRLRGWDEPQVRILATKRAATGDMLERLKVRVDIDGGKVRIQTGLRMGDGTFSTMQRDGEKLRIDLVIDAPRAMTVQTVTFSGAIDASGFRSGASLRSEQGEIRAADINGRVDTNSTAGRQTLQGIHGPLDAHVYDQGDVELEAIDGATLDARVHNKGQIMAREVSTPVVRLSTIVGAIVFVGTLRPGGRYELHSLTGDVRLVLRPAPFRLMARGPRVQVGFALAGDKRGPGTVEGEFMGGGAVLDLMSREGAVSVSPAKN